MELEPRIEKQFIIIRKKWNNSYIWICTDHLISPKWLVMSPFK